MNKYIKIILSAFIISLLFITNKGYALEVYKNEETGYKVYIDDDANLLDETEEEKLKDDMIKITEYSNVAFVTSNNVGTTNTDSFAISYYNNTFGSSSVKGTVFVIDMQNRYMLIRSNGGTDKIITNAKADIITDNTYRYARNSKYYECARETFNQIYTLLDGGKISEPMRHISNLILAIYLSFIVCYLIVMNTVKQQKQNRINTYESTFDMKNVSAEFTGKRKVYSPVSSDSSGGGSSGGGGGGGSSGGHGF